MASQRHILLLSSSSIHGSGYLDYCADTIKQFLGTAISRVAFVPFARVDHDDYASSAREKFNALGYELTSLHEVESKEEAVKYAEALFIGGGNTFRLLSKLYDYNLLPLIREKVNAGMPYIGTSAGSNVACCSIKTTNDMPIVYPCSFDALNLVSFNLNPHYLDPDPSSTHRGETREQRIQEFLEENTNVVIGLREGGILHIEGDVMVLEYGSARIFFPDGHAEEHGQGSDLSHVVNAPIVAIKT